VGLIGSVVRAIRTFSPLLLLRGVLLFGEHLFFAAARSPLFLFSDSMPFSLDCRLFSQKLCFPFLAQNDSRQIAIVYLRSGLLAFDLQRGGYVLDPNTSVHFIDVLTALTRTSDKMFFKIVLEEAELIHAILQRFLFGVRDHHSKF